MRKASKVQKKRESNSEVLPYTAPRSDTEIPHGFGKDSEVKIFFKHSGECPDWGI